MLDCQPAEIQQLLLRTSLLDRVNLFAELLRLELRRRLPGELPALHRLAAAWLSEHGEIIDAIRHTQAAGDWSDALGCSPITRSA